MNKEDETITEYAEQISPVLLAQLKAVYKSNMNVLYTKENIAGIGQYRVLVEEQDTLGEVIEKIAKVVDGGVIHSITDKSPVLSILTHELKDVL